jgi:RNA polymerase sigma factor (sigma-70 family)
MSGETPRRTVVDELADAYQNRKAELNAIAARAGPGEGPDLIQEAFLRVVEANQRVEVRSPVHMLFRVVQNLVTDRLRSRARTSALFDAAAGSVDYLDETSDPERALIASERLRYALAVIGRMTRKRRTIFLLHRLEGLSYSQIAKRTGVSVKTVEKQMSAAMAFLSKEMSE